uniref:PFL family protein n=1 Tax=Thermogemmatispora argillosa TaxID=2045280 RepID=A0A455T0W1_9CHLR|nr:PFL family protein [Thermogemmatispora argillosa]
MVTIRTITLGVAEPHPLTAAIVKRLAQTLRTIATRLSEAGYEVQTLRLATRPLLSDLADWPAKDIERYGRELQAMLNEVDIAFCSLGPALAVEPAFPLDRLSLLADLLVAGPALNASVLLASNEDGLRQEAAPHVARLMLRLAQETPEGDGNFRFAMLACVEAGCPFFPAAYHRGPASLGLGLQSAPLLSQALRVAAATSQPLPLTTISAVVRRTLEDQLRPLSVLASALSDELHLHYNGLDLSPAPLGEASIVPALEACGYGLIGDPGTLAVAAAITRGLQSTTLPTCGYCGLMLPVLEDAILGRRWEEGRLHVHQLLLYSAVCGTGLDTIPLPGDSPEQLIAALLLDVATLATRLRKPLAARLFPVPGKRMGERTAFTSPYLTNTLVR